MSESKIIASEGQQYYFRDGKPCYEVPCKTKDGMRKVNISDARKLDLVPGFTIIKNVAASPGIEAWKLNQVLSSALSLDRLPNEPLEDFSRRAIEEYKKEGERARERGKELHQAIEDYIGGSGQHAPMYHKHCVKTREALLPFEIDIQYGGSAEHSFASELGYGGKIDWHHDSGVLLDFKTKDRIDDKRQLVWDEHPMQCAAYGYGVFKPKFRGLNVFIGVDDCEVRVVEHEWSDLERGFSMFKCLLRYWQVKNRFL